MNFSERGAQHSVNQTSGDFSKNIKKQTKNKVNDDDGWEDMDDFDQSFIQKKKIEVKKCISKYEFDYLMSLFVLAYFKYFFTDKSICIILLLYLN